MDAVGCYFLNQLQLGLWLRTKDGSRFLLKDRERDIFRKLYALLDDRLWLHQEVADYWQLSRERIRQLEVKAFRKLSYRKREKDSPMGRVYAVLTDNHSLLLDDKERLACHFHDFREKHLPEWDEARFFRFVELFLGISELADIWKVVKKNAYATLVRKYKLPKVFEKVIWPEVTVFYPADYLQGFSPQRGQHAVSGKERSAAGERFSAKLGRLLFYESELENKFYRLLDKLRLVHTFCEQPFRLSVNLGKRTVTYTPDVLLQLKDGRCVVVEIKPLINMVETEVQRKFQMLAEYCKRQGWGILLSDGRRDITDLYRFPLNEDFEQALLQKLSVKRRLMRGDLRLLKEEYGTNEWQLARCILRHDLSYRVFPTLLWRTREGSICPLLKDRGVLSQSDDSLSSAPNSSLKL